MAPGYRCVVTGRDAAGKSVIVRDTAVATAALGIADFWKTNTSPASLADDWMPSGPVLLEAPPGGTIFRFFEIPPQGPSLAVAQADQAAAEAFAAAGASQCRVDTRRHPMMHTTTTIDYVVVLRGRVTLLLDEGEVALAPFDVVVQRGTNHYWLNKESEPALLLGVLLDAR
jgi:naringenin degradation protein FdeH